MRWKIIVLLFCTAVLLLAGGAVLSQSSANFQLNWTTIAGGGGDSQSADYRVEGTVGQSLAHSESTSGSYRVEGGFWFGASLSRRLYLPVIVHDN
jgi:hypothetical protein